MIFLSVMVGLALNLLLGLSLTVCITRHRFKQIEPISRWSLIYLLGQLLGSMTYWVWLLLGVHAYGTWILLDLLVIGGFLFVAYRRRQTLFPGIFRGERLSQQMIVAWYVMGALSLLMIWCLSWHVARMPYGAWDAAAMWNYRVSYITMPHAQWTDIFEASVGHPDYPLLHSISAARLCALTGNWQPTVTAWFGVGHALLVLILLLGTVMQRVGVWPAILGAMLLLASDIWWEYTTWQYADITLCCYMFASLVMFCHWLSRQQMDRHALLYATLLLLGTCAWTKNEGWPWVFGISMVILIRLCLEPIPNRRQLIFCSAGCLALVLWMPLSVHMMVQQSNDMVSGLLSDGVFQRLMDTQRLEMIISFYWLYLRLLYPWVIALLLLGICLFIRLNQPRPRSRIGWLVMLLFFGQLSVYLLTFMATPHDLKWHLHTAGDRLFNQVWPLWILGTCLLAGCEKSAKSQHGPSSALHAGNEG